MKQHVHMGEKSEGEKQHAYMGEKSEGAKQHAHVREKARERGEGSAGTECHHIIVEEWEKMEEARGTLFVSIPSLLDPSVAPPGYHTFHAFTPEWIDDWKVRPAQFQVLSPGFPFLTSMTFILQLWLVFITSPQLKKRSRREQKRREKSSLAKVIVDLRRR